MRPHLIQQRLITDPHRFKVISAGRRSGKTERAKRYVAKEALKNAGHSYFIIASTRDHVKTIFWRDMKELLKFWIYDKNESELSITLTNGSYIRLYGMGGKTRATCKIDRLEGSPWHGGVWDEYALSPEFAFKEHLRPILAEHKGWLWFLGVPQGRGHYYKFHLRGLSDAADDRDWNSYTWFSSDIMDPEEVEAARRDSDPRTYRQEYEGSFESYEGSLYYNYDRRLVERPVEALPGPLDLICDFNKSPMVWEVGQVVGKEARIINEISIRTHAKTNAMATLFTQQYLTHPNKTVYVYGDAAGSWESNRDYTTDYSIIQGVLQAAGWRVIMKVPKANPGINNRVNVVCSLIQQGRLKISPRAVFLHEDLELDESNDKGEKDKTDPDRTHGSDDLDYWTWARFAHEFYKTTVRQA